MKKISKGSLFTSLKLVALAGLSVFAVTSNVFAADVRYPTDSGSNLEIPSSVQTKNLYSAAQNLQVNTNVTKDAVLAGQNVTITGSVADDLIAAGMNLELNGTVGGTVRAAGEEVNINRAVSDDVVVAAKDIEISSTASVGGDILAVAKDMQINGPVNGNVSFTGGKLYINSEVKGSIFAKAKSISLGPNAIIDGSVSYASLSKMAMDPAAKIKGQVTQAALPQAASTGEVAASVIIAFIFAFLLQLVGLAFLLRWFSKPVVGAVTKLNSSYWTNVLHGLLYLIAMPIAAVILFVSFLGIYISILVLSMWFILVIVGWGIGLISFGTWLYSLIKKSPQQVSYFAIAIGIFVASLIHFIPFIGFAFSFIITIAGMGAVAGALWKLNKGNSTIEQ